MFAAWAALMEVAQSGHGRLSERIKMFSRRNLFRAGAVGIVAAAIRRWREAAAQWPQIVSGAQSCLGGTHFVMQALNPSGTFSAATVAPYAAFGALYFAISAGVSAFRK